VRNPDDVILSYKKREKSIIEWVRNNAGELYPDQDN
jgi:hypothetical protein